MNKVIISGRLGKDIELRYTQQGKPFGTFSLAVDDGYGDKKKTYWLNVVVWDKLAETCSKSLAKGSKALIEGKLTTRQYEKDGKKLQAWDIVAHSVEFLDGKKKEAAPASIDQSGIDEEIPF